MENALKIAASQLEVPLSSRTITAFSDAVALLEKGVEDEAYPGAVLMVGRNGRTVFQKAVGFKSVRIAKEDPAPLPMTADTVFDVAGVTASVATATLLMKLVEQGKAKLGDRVSNFIQGFGVHNKSPITIGDLLSHSSGLAASHPFFEDLIRENTGARMGILTSKGARDYVINQINRSSLKSQVGSRQLHSEIGLILLGHIVEILTGLSLDKAFHKLVAQPLGLKSTSFIDLAMIRRHGISPVTDIIAPTELCSWRQRVLWGEVHDDNAWAMGGISGSAGLFSTALDLRTLVGELLIAYKGDSTFLRAETVRYFWSGPQTGEPSHYVYGWDAPNRENGMTDVGLSEKAVGNNGFTGCSVWLEPEKGVDILLLSNRVHPSRSNKKITALRPQIHTAVLAALEQC